MNFWIPKYKYELIDWLVRQKGYRRYRLERKTLNELYAMYFGIRRDIEQYSNKQV